MLGLLVAALCILLNGFFVAAEFALVKVRATSVRARAKTGDRKAQVAQDIIERIERYLSVSQLGITVASLGLGWIGEPAVARLMVNGVQRVLGRAPSPAFEVAIHVVALTLLTFGHVIFGELVPKLIAIQQSEATALYAAIPMRLIHGAFRPVLWVLEATSRGVLKVLGFDPEVSEGKLSEEEIVGILAASAASTPQGSEKSRLVERVLRFAQRAARHSMVPRVDVRALSVSANGVDALAFVRRHEYSRIVLTEGASLDDVAGYLYVKDLLLHLDPSSLEDMRGLCRKIIFVPESRSGIDALREMQRKNLPIAIVVDEYGGTSGIVTIEDLLEEIVGEIRDELDDEPQHIVRLRGESEAWNVDASSLCEELRNVGVPVRSEELGESVSATVVARLGRLPRVGDTVELVKGWVVEVVAVSRRRVTRVKLRRHVETEAVEGATKSSQ